MLTPWAALFFEGHRPNGPTSEIPIGGTFDADLEKKNRWKADSPQRPLVRRRRRAARYQGPDAPLGHRPSRRPGAPEVLWFQRQRLPRRTDEAAPRRRPHAPAPGRRGWPR
jgi:hypothetical protein